MTRKAKRWLAVLLLGALAFSQASFVLAACAMDRSALHHVLSAQDADQSCDEAALSGGEGRPISANGCIANSILDLQLPGAAGVIVPGPSLAPHFFAPSPARTAWYISKRDGAPPGIVPPRILLHSFLI